MAHAELERVYLITGSDRPKVETAVARLRGRFVPEATEAVSAQELSGVEAVALCNAGSLFGDARLVLVEGVDGRRNAEGRLANGWKAADVKAVEEYLASPAPDTVLALVAEEVKKDAPLAKACAKAGSVLTYDIVKKRLDAWIAARFEAAGVRAEPEACAALLQLVGEDLHALAAEVDKLALWANGEPVGEREVEALVAAVAETPTFALTDAWGARDLSGTTGANPLGRARQPSRLRPPLRPPRGRGGAPARRREHPEAPSVLRGEGLRAGRVLLRGRARRRHRTARPARPRPQGREQAGARPGAAAGAGRPRRRALARGVARDERGDARLLARRGVLVQRALRRRLVDRAHEQEVLGRDRVGVAAGDGRLEALRQRLHGRPVAKVLVPLPLGDPDALLLLLDVGHVERKARAKPWGAGRAREG
jgi:hypothetical protein